MINSALLWTIANYTVYAVGIYVVICYLLYFIPPNIITFLPAVNVKKRYRTEWALVTGGSSGIGAALCTKLAQQGLNIVIVALEDKLLEKKVNELRLAFPDLEFRSVGVNLAGDDYMDKIIEAVADIDVGAVFNNAGFIRLGAFSKFTAKQHEDQIRVNQLSYVKISHFFYTRWKANPRRPEGERQGLLAFTVSSAGFFIAPYSIMYSATKAFLNNFCASLAIEGAHNGIDVTQFNPQYTKTNLYATTPEFSLFDMLSVIGSTPEEVAEQILRSVGRLSIRDQGAYSYIMRFFANTLFGYDWLIPIMAKGLTLAPEYKTLK